MYGYRDLPCAIVRSGPTRRIPTHNPLANNSVMVFSQLLCIYCNATLYTAAIVVCDVTEGLVYEQVNKPVRGTSTVIPVNTSQHASASCA